MGFLFYLLGRYEGYFDHARLFFALLVGLFAGLLVRFLELYLFPFENLGHPDIAALGWVYSLFYTTVGFAFLDSAAKAAVLGMGRFRTRKDAPYHGTALGAAFGGMWTQTLMVPLLPMADGRIRIDEAALIQWALLFLFSAGLILTHAAAGAWVGKGTADGRLVRGLLHGTAWTAPAMALYWMFANGLYAGFAILGLAGWGVFSALFAQRRILDTVVPAHVRKQLASARRREERRKRRGA